MPGPVNPIGTGRVVGHHLVRVGGVSQRMAARPHLPSAVQPDHRVLHAGLRVPGEYDLAPAGVELGRVLRFQQLDPPVLGAGRGAAQVQPPPPGVIAHQPRPLQGLRPGLFAPDGCERLEAHPVGRPRHGDGVPPADPDRQAQPVGEIDPVVAQGGAGCTGPVAQAGARRRDHDGGLIGTRQQRRSRALGRLATKHTEILDSHCSRVLGKCKIVRICACLPPCAPCYVPVTYSPVAYRRA